MRKPLVIELFSGMFGWSAGWLELGGKSIGFDLEHLPHHGPIPQGSELVLQDVLTLHGKQFRDAELILASPPCTEYSYMAMPWKRAKQIAAALRGQGEFPEGYTGSRTIADLNRLFEACFRIQREACGAAGRYIPMVVENVKGAQPWVGRAQANFGSFYLWGDVGMVGLRIVRRDARFGAAYVEAARGGKNSGGSWFNIGSPGQKVVGCNPVTGVKSGGYSWSDYGKEGYRPIGFNTENARRLRENGYKWGECAGKRFDQRPSGNVAAHRERGDRGDVSRIAATATIAKIPYPLSCHIARIYYPT